MQLRNSAASAKGGVRWPPPLRNGYRRITARKPAARWFGLVSAALSAAAWLLGSSALSSAQRDLGEARRNLALSEVQKEGREARKQRADLQQQLIQRMRTQGLAQSQWTERRLNIQQVAMSRPSVRDVLADIARGPGRVFVVEQFEMSVARPDEDLFTSPHSGAALVTLSLRGQLFSREER